ncbi:MAG TPA: hypothetical protein VF011_21445 [Terriglobales bacterium]
MKALRVVAFALTIFVALSSAAQTTPVVFNLNPIRLTNDWVIKGTITTDGTVGPLTLANILDWNFKIVQTTQRVWTEKDSNDWNISGVSTNGKKIFVATSPDGFQDGGTLYFGRSAGWFNIPTNAVIADFTQLSMNLGYIGGIAGWQDEIWGLNYVGLNQRDNTQYPAASALANRVNTFAVRVPTLSTSPLLMTLFGTITTDGTLGTLLPQNIIAWNITARNQDIRYMDKASGSRVISATALSSTGKLLGVAHAGGQLVIGFPGFRPTFVSLADFTDPTMPNGFANYYVGNYGEMGNKTPLVNRIALTRIVATAP